jgi:hypothetical protein
MLEFPDGAYTVRIRNNQQARQEQQRRERERSSSSGEFNLTVQFLSCVDAIYSSILGGSSGFP